MATCAALVSVTGQVELLQLSADEPIADVLQASRSPPALACVCATPICVQLCAAERSRLLCPFLLHTGACTLMRSEA
jgi:hypothetical protein